MFMRAVNFRIDPARLDAFREEAEGVRAKMKSMQGLSHQFTGLNADGNGLSVGIWETEEALKAGQPQVQAIWAGLGDYLQAPPSPTDFPYVEQLAGPAHEM
jgi:heme-degrading monooxygenase HmoA